MTPLSSTDIDGTALPPDHPDDEAAFTDVLDRHRRVLVYFHADWCRRCEAMNPLVAGVAEDGDAGVLWVEVERHPAIAARYHVSAVPTLVAFDGGEPAERLVGIQDESTIEAAVPE